MEETEITNRVLETKIDGLSKITDERFLNIKETLVRIEQNSNGYALRIELEDVKKDFVTSIQRIANEFIKHNADDKLSFATLELGQQKVNNTISKWIGISIGVSLIGSPLLTIGIGYIISLFSK